jgi:hypothetical protein
LTNSSKTIGCGLVGAAAFCVGQLRGLLEAAD